MVRRFWANEASYCGGWGIVWWKWAEAREGFTVCGLNLRNKSSFGDQVSVCVFNWRLSHHP
ncbi:hypothetical protein HPG69_019109 [Diceros bicornis minor]|uniref:Uncharacterized protein n=1 Tax=Diceros bicornis minor TaxID=77932 RepID=A0A7J7FGK4_DICBM|nr:hypothetical protein HPG69_019109 [Diceros bicornis minor]